jgi:hypothetical protein
MPESVADISKQVEGIFFPGILKENIKPLLEKVPIYISILARCSCPISHRKSQPEVTIDVIVERIAREICEASDTVPGLRKFFCSPGLLHAWRCSIFRGEIPNFPITIGRCR